MNAVELTHTRQPVRSRTHHWSRRVPVRIRTAADGVRIVVWTVALAGVVIPAAVGDASAIAVGLSVVLVLMSEAVRAVALRWRAARPAGTELVHLLLATVYVSVVNLDIGQPPARPFSLMYFPLVALAARLGVRESLAIAATAAAGLSLQLFESQHIATSTERALTFVAASAMLAVGARSTVGAMEHQAGRLRSLAHRTRVQARQIEALDAVGARLASPGPTAIQDVVDQLADRFHYDLVSVYLVEPAGARLAAQRGYADPVPFIEAGTGLIGRVMRTRQLVHAPDVRLEPDYLAGSSRTRSEIAVPLLDGDDLLGVLNIESAGGEPLASSDVLSARAIADRLGVAIALDRERRRLRDRAGQLERLIDFTALVSRTLRPDELYLETAKAMGGVVPGDLVSLTVHDPATGHYLVRAVAGAPDAERFAGLEVPPGVGMAGKAIERRTLVHSDAFAHGERIEGLEDASFPETWHAVAVPMIQDDEVLGAISVARFDQAAGFTALELEVLPLVAAQVALAIRNAQLHASVADSAIRDPLTGLHNRRFFDDALAQLLAARGRSDERRPVSVVLFDLDHFGEVNKRHGHATGDDVLRIFAAVLTDRARRADLSARYGGEEFVLILDGATGEVAAAVADAVRLAFLRRSIMASDGSPINHSVSAGIAVVAPEDDDATGAFLGADVALSMAKRAGRNQVVRA